MIEYLFLLALIFIGYFILSHLRPLNNNEIIQLGSKRRTSEIKNYYTFDRSESVVNKSFKSGMDTAGKYYHVNERLTSFPSTAAALLKYKKHEWVIIGFEYNKRVSLLWCNKGLNNSSVSLGISPLSILNRSSMKTITSILCFHNHPNPNPQQYSMNRPSEMDHSSASQWSSILRENGINLLEFVCERGIPYEYYRSISDTFLPLDRFIEHIKEVNDISRYDNLKLHLERLI